MSKRGKKKYTKEETEAFNRRYLSQDFKQVKDKKYEWVDITFYMLDHDKCLGLSGNAFKLYAYMRKWAYMSEDWKKTNTFEYSQSLAQTKNIMSQAEAKRCLNELWEKGFIEKLSRGKRGTNRWKFSSRRYTGQPKDYEG